MFKEIEDCYLNSAGVFVRVVVDTQTNVMYLSNKKTIIPMLSRDGKPNLYTKDFKIKNCTNKIRKLHKYTSWQNIFVNMKDGTMYIGREELLCQLLDADGKPKICNDFTDL